MSRAPCKKTICFRWSPCYWNSKCTSWSKVFLGQLPPGPFDHWNALCACLCVCVRALTVTSRCAWPTVSDMTNRAPIISHEGRGSHAQRWMCSAHVTKCVKLNVFALHCLCVHTSCCLRVIFFIFKTPFCVCFCCVVFTGSSSSCWHVRNP